MKIIKIIILLTVLSAFPSCSCLNSRENSDKAYKRGFDAGVATERKRIYWQEKSMPAPIETPLPAPVAQEIVIPEHTASDGVLIEQHNEFVEPETNETP